MELVVNSKLATDNLIDGKCFQSSWSSQSDDSGVYNSDENQSPHHRSALRSDSVKSVNGGALPVDHLKASLCEKNSQEIDFFQLLGNVQKSLHICRSYLNSVLKM